MNQFKNYLQILILLVGFIYPFIASSQGTSCEAPIDLNPFIPENGNGNYKLSVDNSESSQFYTYTATQVGHIEMSSAFSNVPGDGAFDSYLRVYNEQCQIIFDEDDSPGLFGGVEFYSEVAIGDTYIFEWSNHEWAGEFEVEFIYHVPVIGESCDDLADLSIGSNTVDFWFGDQYYTYTATSPGLLEISTCNLWNAEGSNIMLLDACDGSEIGISSDACDYDIVGWESITYEIEQGEEVIVEMIEALHKHHDYTFDVAFTPEGEACELPFDLSITPEDIHQVPHACTTCRTNKWYEFTAPKTGEAIVTTGQAGLARFGSIGGQEFTHIKIYSDCDGEPIAENAQYYQFFGSSHIEIEFQEAETYYIEFVAEFINDSYYFDIFYLEDLLFGTEEVPLEVTPGLNATHANMYYAGEQYETGDQWFLYEFEADGELTVNVTNYYNLQTLVSVISENEHQFTYPDDDSGPDGFKMDGVTGDVVLLGLSRTNNTFTVEFIEECESHEITKSESACTSYLFDNEELLTSGDYSATFTNQAGCDSLVNLTLTISNCDVVWSEGAWSNGTGPTALDDVVIDDDYSLSINGVFESQNIEVIEGSTITVSSGTSLDLNGDIANNGSIIIESGGSLLTYAVNNLVGNPIVIQRNTRYSDGSYSFVGSPVEQNTNATASDLGGYVYTYDEAASDVETSLARWLAAGDTDQLIPGQGYTQANQQLIEFEGIPNSGTITYSGSYVNDGWHLVSNPYSAAIFIDDFIDANLSATTGSIYIWDDNDSESGRGSNDDYIVANKTGAIDINATDGLGPNSEGRWSEHIGSGQGFFVQLDGAPGDIAFTESMRRSGNNGDANFFRKSAQKKSLLRINLTNELGLFKQAIVGFNNDISVEKITSGYDAPVFNRTAPNSIFTFKADTRLTIQTVTEEKAEIPLGLNIEEEGSYQISLKTENYSGQLIYLKDNLTNQIIDLSQNTYSFMSSAGQIRDRFVLIKSSAVLDVAPQKPGVYAFEKTLFINGQAETAHYAFYNLSGKMVMQIEVKGSVKVDLSHLKYGIYLVSDGIESKKIVLK